MVSRCEIDMVQIKHEFQRAYTKTLDSFIKVSSLERFILDDFVIVCTCPIVCKSRGVKPLFHSLYGKTGVINCYINLPASTTTRSELGQGHTHAQVQFAKWSGSLMQFDVR